MKTCSTCKETKNHTEFYKQARNKDGLFGQCKFCINEKSRGYYLDNKERIRKQQNESKQRNPEDNKRRCKERYKNKKEDIDWVTKERERFKAHRKNNLGKYAAKEAKRRAAKLRATAPWANFTYVQDLYKNCREAEDVFNAAGLSVKFHVDHIVPLQHDRVCGLHVEHNLQVLTAAENSSKCNKYEVS